MKKDQPRKNFNISFMKFVSLCSLSSLIIKGTSNESLCVRHMFDYSSFDESHFINQLLSRPAQLSNLYHVQFDLEKTQGLHVNRSGKTQ